MKATVSFQEVETTTARPMIHASKMNLMSTLCHLLAIFGALSLVSCAASNQLANTPTLTPRRRLVLGAS